MTVAPLQGRAPQGRRETLARAVATAVDRIPGVVRSPGQMHGTIHPGGRVHGVTLVGESVTIHVHVDVALYGHPLGALGESARQAAQEALVVAGDTRVAHVVIEDLVTGPPALPGELS